MQRDEQGDAIQPSIHVFTLYQYGHMILSLLENYPVIVVMTLKVSRRQWIGVGDVRENESTMLNWHKCGAGGQRRRNDQTGRRTRTLNGKSSDSPNVFILQMGKLRPREGKLSQDTEYTIGRSIMQPRFFLLPAQASCIHWLEKGLKISVFGQRPSDHSSSLDSFPHVASLTLPCMHTHLYAYKKKFYHYP